jgi:hypothetical protein
MKYQTNTVLGIKIKGEEIFAVIAVAWGVPLNLFNDLLANVFCSVPYELRSVLKRITELGHVCIYGIRRVHTKIILQAEFLTLYLREMSLAGDPARLHALV